MNISINNSTNFKANLMVSSSKVFSSKVNSEKVAESFKKATKNFIKDLEVQNVGSGFGVCANIKDEIVDLTNLSLKKITNEDILVDKLVRAYKMLITEKVLLNAKNRRDCEDVTHYTNRLLELAGKDRDLLKNLDFVL